MSKKRETNFNNVAVFALGRTVLLMSMWARNMMLNAYATKKRVEFFVLPSPVTLDSKNFPIKLTFNEFLKFLEYRENFRFVSKQINPSELAIIIDKTDVIFFSTKRISGMAPYITENKF